MDDTPIEKCYTFLVDRDTFKPGCVQVQAVAGLDHVAFGRIVPGSMWQVSFSAKYARLTLKESEWRKFVDLSGDDYESRRRAIAEVFGVSIDDE